MSAGHQPKSYLSFGVTAPQNATTQITKLTIDNEMRLNLVVDYYMGKVAGTPSLQLQDSTGFNTWSTVKTTALSASTDQAVTVSANVWTAPAHGYDAGQVVVINSTGNLPGGYQAGTRAFIQNPTANTFQLALDTNPQSASIYTTDSGTGSLTVTAMSLVTVRLNVQVAGDQAVMPLRPQGRAIITCTGGQSAQVLDVRTGYTY